MLNKEESYIIGFFQADGTLYEQDRNRGRLSVELSKKDEDILYKINNIVLEYSSIKDRVRDTNFKENYESSILSIYDINFRNKLKKYIPVGKKDDKIKFPTDVVDVDYIRGLIDGDGSVGFTSKGFPFVSFVTSSEHIARGYENFIYNNTGKLKKNNPNARDGVYNIMVTKEDAQKLVSVLYYKGCLSLDRKHNSAMEVLKWERPEDMVQRGPTKKWDSYQDEYILNNSIEMSMEHLNRSKQSIKTRLWRLRKSK